MQRDPNSIVHPHAPGCWKGRIAGGQS
jgi:hypothetical protein